MGNYSHNYYTTPRWTFGKFKGERISETPTSYLCWALDSGVALRYGLDGAIREELADRLQVRARHTASYTGRVPVGVTPQAAIEIIAAGRRAVARQNHPDMGGAVEAMIEYNSTADWLTEHVERMLSGVRA